MIKKLISVSFGAGLLLAAAVPAFADDNKCVNVKTGPLSRNTCEKLLKKKVWSSIFNDSYLKQRAYVEAETGENESKKNTLGGSITTDPANATVVQAADANTNFVDVTQSDETNDGGGKNILTGPGSTNTVEIKNIRKVGLIVENISTIKQKAVVEAETGDNKNSWNTVGGDINTGSATADVTQEASVNWNQITINQ